MKLAVALSAVALSATALVAPPVAAAPAPGAPASLVKKSFTLCLKFTTRLEVPYGNRQGIGNLAVSQGELTDTSDKKAGTLTSVNRVVAPSPKKDAELRDTQLSVVLSDGTIFSQAVNEDPKGKPPAMAHIMPVTGGTGAYASARGTLNLYKPIFCDSYGIGFDIFVEKDLKTSTLRFAAPVTKVVTGTGVQGIGNVTLARAASGDTSYISIATRAGSSRGTVTDSIDLQVFTADGSLFARAIATVKGGGAKSHTFAVLGGTGTYAGHRGELTLSANGRAITLRLAAPSGSAKPLNWFEDGGRGVTLPITGATFLGVEGKMFDKADRKKQVGDYFATRVTYDEIDGVTPIVTMLEQDFKIGTMIVSGITLSAGDQGTSVTRPIIGGTGDYGGAAGQVSSLEESPNVWRKTGRFWR